MINVNINCNDKILAHWMKRNNVEKANFCLPFFYNKKTDIMEKIMLMGLKFDKTKLFKTLHEIETEMGCGIFQVTLNGKK